MRALSTALELIEVPDPQPRAHEAVIRVSAAGVNRADLLQRSGHYPAPAGASDILGLECSGIVESLPARGQRHNLRPGDPVCALLRGGGYAERVAVPVEHILPIPSGFSLTDAAALPEVTATAWLNLMELGQLRKGNWVLIHGAGGGLGNFCLQFAAAQGARVAVTVGSETARTRCLDQGAEMAINYRDQDFAAELSGTEGMNLILDIIGAKYLDQNLRSLAPHGRLVTIGLQGGRRAELDLALILSKQLHLTGSALRNLAPAKKETLLTAVHREIWPLLADKIIAPAIAEVLPWTAASQAHNQISAGGHFGKFVLEIAP